jgi:hypothetical protein
MRSILSNLSAAAEAIRFDFRLNFGLLSFAVVAHLTGDAEIANGSHTVKADSRNTEIVNGDGGEIVHGADNVQTDGDVQGLVMSRHRIVKSGSRTAGAGPVGPQL